MNLVAINCPQCGAKLELTKDMMFCSYCGSKIEIVKNEGTAPTNYLQLGLYYLQMGELRQADRYFSRLLEKIPTSNLAWFWRSIISLLNGGGSPDFSSYDGTSLDTAIQYWQQSAISNDNAVTLLIQVFKPGHYAIESLITVSPFISRSPGGWNLFTVIINAGLEWGMQDLVVKSCMIVAKDYVELYDYILKLDASKHDEVIEDCLKSAKYYYWSEYDQPIRENLEARLNYVKKIDPDGEKLVKNFWLEMQEEERRREEYQKKSDAKK